MMLTNAICIAGGFVISILLNPAEACTSPPRRFKSFEKIERQHANQRKGYGELEDWNESLGITLDAFKYDLKSEEERKEFIIKLVANGRWNHGIANLIANTWMLFDSKDPRKIIFEDFLSLFVAQGTIQKPEKIEAPNGIDLVNHFESKWKILEPTLRIVQQGIVHCIRENGGCPMDPLETHVKSPLETTNNIKYGISALSTLDTKRKICNDEMRKICSESKDLETKSKKMKEMVRKKEALTTKTYHIIDEASKLLEELDTNSRLKILMWSHQLKLHNSDVSKEGKSSVEMLREHIHGGIITDAIAMDEVKREAFEKLVDKHIGSITRRSLKEELLEILNKMSCATDL